MDLRDLDEAKSLYSSTTTLFRRRSPSLVHHGRPVSESAVILEYVDETWRDAPRILPEYPYERSRVRFWSKFIDQQLIGRGIGMLRALGESQVASINEVQDKLKVLEEGIKHML